MYDTAQSNFVSITVSQRYSEETTNFLFDPPLGPGGFNSCRTKFPKKSNDIAFVIGITKAKHWNYSTVVHCGTGHATICGQCDNALVHWEHLEKCFKNNDTIFPANAENDTNGNVSILFKQRDKN